jgi:AmmeMemoRadiSam system protein B
MGRIRPPAVAGTFYPADANDLQQLVNAYLAQAAGGTIAPKAIIAPHAGYIYSGPVAASAYKWLDSAAARDAIQRVVLLGPAHRVAFPGLATHSADAFLTPLGRVPLDKEAVALATALPQVSILDAAHQQEHSLEVQLPFLQSVLNDFKLVPFVVGNASPAESAEVLKTLWGGPETLIVISSDLSHFHNYHTAQKLDLATAEAIETLQPDKIGYDRACGRIGIQALLLLAQKHGLNAQRVDLRNSGDIADSREQVVGYGAWVFT